MKFEVGKMYHITSKQDPNLVRIVKIIKQTDDFVKLEYPANEADNREYAFTVNGTFFHRWHWELVNNEPTVPTKDELEFLIDIALATHDKEWFHHLTKQMEVTQ